MKLGPCQGVFTGFDAVYDERLGFRRQKAATVCASFTKKDWGRACQARRRRG